MRDGWYLNGDGDRVAQAVRFKAGDTLLTGIKAGRELSTKDNVWKAARDYHEGETIHASSELIGVAKGMRQILAERQLQYIVGKGCLRDAYKKKNNDDRKLALQQWKANRTSYDLLLSLLHVPTEDEVEEGLGAIVCNCACCVLSDQPDFKSQPSGLQDVYDKYNAAHGAAHRCVFLPKFHPELNPIERVWSKMKFHVRRKSDGSLETLENAMREGLKEPNLTLCTIRKYCRLVYGYYEAYLIGHDIVTAQAWLSQRKTHRGYAPNMDYRLEAIYFPTARTLQFSPSPPTATSEPSENLDHLEDLIDEFAASHRI